ncbi:hypothetical protein [Halovulum dunhuangense]|uniref:hypothetical protein n=1 Tax=Halovulum dunhuangense TaxID=1505036 RepID=UPI00148DC66F|nr:hypothetical protein [Halovulum dunhuangense]
MTLLACGAFVAACSQPEPAPPPPVIQGEPIYDKFGGVTGCTSGVYVPGAAPQDQCLPPPDECTPNSTTAADPCLPLRDDDRGRDPTTPDPQTPGTAPVN